MLSSPAIIHAGKRDNRCNPELIFIFNNSPPPPPPLLKNASPPGAFIWINTVSWTKTSDFLGRYNQQYLCNNANKQTNNHERNTDMGLFPYKYLKTNRKQ